MSIRLRLTLWYSGLLAVTLFSFGITLYLYVNQTTFNDTKERLIEEAQRVHISAFSPDLFRLELEPKMVNRDLIFQLVNYTNNKILQSDILSNAEIQFPYPKPDANLAPGFQEIRVDPYPYPFLIYQQPIVARGRIVGLLQVADYMENEVKFLDNFRNTMFLSSLGVVLIAFTIGMFLARKALKPVENVIRAANQIENGSNLSVRIPREGPPNDEIGRVADTLNGMLARLETTYNELEEAYKAQRRFVSDASHELRTPLTTIRGNVDLLEKMWTPQLTGADREQGVNGKIVLDGEKAAMSLEAMRDISDEAKRMSRLVSDMLSLARADAGYVMEKSNVSLLPIVEEVARRAQLLPRSVELRVADLSPIRGIELNGHADYLRQLLFIFIENAFKYTTEGYAELQVKVFGGQAGLVIKDTGIGMNREEVPHIFERFYRADVSRGKTAGTGLGLSIAKWIIDEHNGSIEVKTREGEGTTFTIWLPIAFSRSEDSVIIDEPDRYLE